MTTRVEEESERIRRRKERRCRTCGEPVSHPKHRGITRTHDYAAPFDSPLEVPSGA